MHNCLPTKIKCEWAILKSFVAYFNNTFHTQYTLTKCLDLDGNCGPQPEILLDSPGLKSLVIERKAVIYPKNYAKYHQTAHDFGDAFFEKLKGRFDDDVYQLEINPKNLRGSKKKIHEMACQIADVVIGQQDYIVKTGYISSSIPIEWCFKRLQPIEKNEDTPERGVGICFDESPEFIDRFFKEFYRNPSEYLTKLGIEQEEKYLKAQKEIISIIRKLLVNTSAKFENYSTCLRILLLEAYVDIEHPIQEIIKLLDIPSNIDHIWLTNTYSDGYERIYKRIDCNL